MHRIKFNSWNKVTEEDMKKGFQKESEWKNHLINKIE